MSDLVVTRSVEEGTEIDPPEDSIDVIEAELTGLVSLELPTVSLPVLARRLAIHLEVAQAQPLPDNALIATLCEAARLVWMAAGGGRRNLADEELARLVRQGGAP